MKNKVNSKIETLIELGILCMGKPMKGEGYMSADPGPHEYSGHNQLCGFEHPRYRYPFVDETRETYTIFPDDTTLDEALEQTRIVVLLGIADSEQMRACLADTQCLVMVFEPDERVFAKYLEARTLAELNRAKFICFTGDPCSFNPALQDILPGEMFKSGTPAFFVTDRIRKEYAEWSRGVIEYLEILHYRNAIYGISGQGLKRSYPVRNITRGLLFDQQFHAYENIGAFMTSPSLAALRNRMRGKTAILVAAGPEMHDKAQYIRANRDRTVVICVNNAVKPLVEAGVTPHFVVINDTSVEAGKVFDTLPKLPETILVAHCLSYFGNDVFGQKFLFGNFLPDVFGSRDMIRLHGSVISTAFGLAQYMGCSKMVLVGVQLASTDPWNLGYAKGVIPKRQGEKRSSLIGRHPQLYPVKNQAGEVMYTTVNFRDAALWLAEVVRLSGIECINTSKASILVGEGIEYHAEPELSEDSIMPIMAELLRVRPNPPDMQGVSKYIRHEIAMWSAIRDAVKALFLEDDDPFVAKGMAILEQLDQTNVTYLVERYDDFCNWEFHTRVFEGDDESRRKGLRYFFGYALKMSEGLLVLLKKAANSL